MTPFRTDRHRMHIIDLHTHNIPESAGSAVYCLPLGVTEIPAGQICSAGIHPWNAETAGEEQFAWVERMLSLDSVVSVGEVGFDRLRGPSLNIQEAVFARQVELSEKYGKPLVIHSVKSTDLLLAMKRELCPAMPWAVHGFRGGTRLAGELLDHGLSISFGVRSNPDALRYVGIDRMLAETDSHIGIDSVISAMAPVLGIPADVVTDRLQSNLSVFLEPVLARWEKNCIFASEQTDK